MAGATVIRWISFVFGVGALSAGAFVAYSQLGGAAGDPFDEAGRLVPADSHVFVAINTDLTSAPWRALPDLLTRLGIQEDFLKERDAKLLESGLDYSKDVQPVLGTIRALAMAVQVQSTDSAEAVAVVDSRDPAAVSTLIERLMMAPNADLTRTSSRDDTRLLDILAFPYAPNAPLVIARRGDLLYIAEQLEAIEHLLDRLAAAGPMSDSPRYRDLRSQGESDALMLTFVNGTALDALASDEIIDEMVPSLGVDPRGIVMLVTTSATTSGFEVHGHATSTNGFGKLAPNTASDARMTALAQATPREAQLFIATVGLRESIESGLEALEAAQLAEGDAILSSIEESSGVELRRDILPLLGDAYSVAGRIDDIESFSGWFVFQTESPDANRLASALQAWMRAIEVECACSTDLVVEARGGLVQVRWPSAPLPASSLTDDAGFAQTSARLPDANTSLMYFNASALPRSLFDELAPEASNVRLERILGIGASSSVTDNAGRFSVVMPVGTGP